MSKPFLLAQTINSHLENHGDFNLDLRYWDCECKENYIHSIGESICTICDSLQSDCPNSRENEVVSYLEIVKNRGGGS